jgi:hypothetical protein
MIAANVPAMPPAKRMVAISEVKEVEGWPSSISGMGVTASPSDCEDVDDTEDAGAKGDSERRMRRKRMSEGSWSDVHVDTYRFTHMWRRRCQN